MRSGINPQRFRLRYFGADFHLQRDQMVCETVFGSKTRKVRQFFRPADVIFENFALI